MEDHNDCFYVNDGTGNAGVLECGQGEYVFAVVLL
jgi:hypothetical protein